MNKLINILTISLFSMLLLACKDDDSAFIRIADVQKSYEFKEIGGTRFVTVKTNQTVTVTSSDKDWCIAELYPGGRNNNLRITAERNILAEDRYATVTITSEGVEPVTITVQQDGAQPFLTLTELKVDLGPTDSVFTLEINSNIDFTYELPSWVIATEDNIPQVGKVKYNFEAKLLATGSRTGTIKIIPTKTSIGISPITIPIKQSKTIVFFEDHFDWATGSNDIFTSTGEISMSSWPSTVLWTSSTSGVYDVWTRNGYLKFCRGNTGADLITPKLTEIVGTKDIVVTFKACAYHSGTGVKEKFNECHVSVLGTGTISGTSDFTITDYPDTNAHQHGADVPWTDYISTVYSVKVSGATAETQIRFLVGPKLGKLDETGNCRMGMDDVVIILDN